VFETEGHLAVGAEGWERGRRNAANKV